MGFKVVIPARYASTRLPAKPLADLGGRPMIQWVVDGARAAALPTKSWSRRTTSASPRLRAIRARRHARLRHDARRSHVGNRSHRRGRADARLGRTHDRRERAGRRAAAAAAADRPGRVAAGASRATRDIATLCTPITSVHEFLDPNVVKVVTGRGGVALYFSRAPIPWHRDGAAHGLASQTSILGAQRHLGIYAYRVDALRRLTAMPPSDLEVTEKLEQLRALQAGMRLVVGIAVVPPPAGVDTEADVRACARRCRRDTP